MRTLRLVLLLMAGVAAWPAFANDSVAEIGVGGIVLARTQDVAMVREDLYLSMKEVKVDYVFRNETDEDVESIVAFPLPDIDADPDAPVALPEAAGDNFLDFFVMVGGKMLQPQLEQKAFSLNIDVTEMMKQNNVPLYPYDPGVAEALNKLPDAVVKDFVDRDIIQVTDQGDDSEERFANWSLRSVYWWKSTFPAGKDVAVSHRYKPAVGGTSTLTFFNDGRFNEDALGEYEDTYCIDAAFKAAVQKATTKGGMTENHLKYILTTGGNWSASTIGEFKLTVDKGSPDNLVSFCGEGVKKVGPTTFEMTKKDFFPEEDLAVLILTPQGQ